MNLFETLKQFKNITPDPAYQEKSKRIVLSFQPLEASQARAEVHAHAQESHGIFGTIRRSLVHILETGVAVALTVFFILIITGQFPTIPYASPVQFSVIDPQTLHAEAQAIDIQIQLAQVSYQEPAVVTESATTSDSTAPQAAVNYSRLAAALKAAAGSTEAASSSSSSATATSTESTGSMASTTVSVDQALKALSE